MKIGIGVCTYNRPKHIDLWLIQLNNTWGRKETFGLLPYENKSIAIGDDTKIFIADDSQDRKGIAYRKNECLKALKDCDYIFLFDEDCFPIKDGWADFFINAHKESGQHHFMYLKETPNIKGIKTVGNIKEYNNCAGCMMFLTKEVIEKVGGYNSAYGFYGFEHAGYSDRIHSAGLTPLGKYTCPIGAGEYIYSLDLDNHLPFNKQLKHEPSMANEIQNIPTYVALNKEIYYHDIQTIYQPLE